MIKFRLNFVQNFLTYTRVNTVLIRYFLCHLLFRELGHYMKLSKAYTETTKVKSSSTKIPGTPYPFQNWWYTLYTHFMILLTLFITFAAACFESVSQESFKKRLKKIKICLIKKTLLILIILSLFIIITIKLLISIIRTSFHKHILFILLLMPLLLLIFCLEWLTNNWL